MACSRMPKCMLRPPRVAASNSPAPSKVRRVLVEGARSAAPPISQGTFWARMLRILPEESRVAMPLASAGKVGRSLSHPSGSWRNSILCRSSASSGIRLCSIRIVLSRRCATRRRACRCLSELLVDAVGDQEFFVLRPAVEFVGERDFFRAERFAVSFVGVLVVRRAVADVAVDDNQCGLVSGLTENVESLGERDRVVGVGDVFDVPTVAFEARGHVFAEGQAGVAFDGDVVVVVDPAEIGSLWWPASDAASPEMPSIMSPSPQMT